MHDYYIYNPLPLSVVKSSVPLIENGNGCIPNGHKITNGSANGSFSILVQVFKFI